MDEKGRKRALAAYDKPAQEHSGSVQVMKLEPDKPLPGVPATIAGQDVEVINLGNIYPNDFLILRVMGASQMSIESLCMALRTTFPQLKGRVCVVRAEQIEIFRLRATVGPGAAIDDNHAEITGSVR